MYTQLKNTSLTVGFQNENVVNFRHTAPANISIETRYYFVENLGQSYAQAFISGGPQIRPDENGISIALYVFCRSNLYERYIDMLRNEHPVYIEFYCEINENESNYKDTTQHPTIELLPISQLQISGLSSVKIRTFNEEVGEGE